MPAGLYTYRYVLLSYIHTFWNFYPKVVILFFWIFLIKTYESSQKGSHRTSSWRQGTNSRIWHTVQKESKCQKKCVLWSWNVAIDQIAGFWLCQCYSISTLNEWTFVCNVSLWPKSVPKKRPVHSFFQSIAMATSQVYSSCLRCVVSLLSGAALGNPPSWVCLGIGNAWRVPAWRAEDRTHLTQQYALPCSINSSCLSPSFECVGHRCQTLAQGARQG